MTSTTVAPQLSLQQQAVLDWFVRDRGNAFVTAVAGAGKTSTLLQLIREALVNPRNSVAYAAFNKAIADEVKAKLKKMGIEDRRIQVGTFHSFGWRAWSRAYPDCKLSHDMSQGARKWDIIQAKLTEKLADRDGCTKAQAHAVIEKLVPAVRKLVSYAMSAAIFPEQFANTARWFELVEHYGLEEELEDPSQIQRVVGLAQNAIQISIKIAHQVCEFDDMIYMPVISGTKVWQNDVLLVDEAQDTNPIRMMLARAMMKPRWGRAVFVGDPAQAIYGFSGADARAVERIKSDFYCADLPLTVTFRCPKKVVAEAQRYVSHIVAADSAPEGSVAYTQLDTVQALVKEGKSPFSDRDAILCRKTKPLLELAYYLIRNSIPCKLEGKEIGVGLKNLLNKWKTREVPEYLDRLDAWAETKIATYLAKGEEMKAENLADRVACMHVLCENCATKDSVALRIDTMFGDNVSGMLTLATVHRSKGREWNHVYILGANAWMPLHCAKKPWEIVQENNLLYVGITRSQGQLTWISVEE